MNAFLSSLVVMVMLLCTAPEPAVYEKNYHGNGQLASEGWRMGSQKIKYWKYYYKNGQLSSQGSYKKAQEDGYWYYYNREGRIVKEGHYKQGVAQDWWIFYDLAKREKRKIQYDAGKKNGYCLVYKKNTLIRAEKYEQDKRTGQWTSVREFKRDNPEVSLLRL